MINAQILQGNWNEIKGSLKSHWGTLTHDDLRSFNGNVDQLIGKIQRKTGESRAAVQRYLEEISDDASSMVSSAAETARGFARTAAGTVQDSYEQVADQLRDGYAGAENLVRSKPAESLIVAFGTGLFAGLIAGLVMRKR